MCFTLQHAVFLSSAHPDVKTEWPQRQFDHGKLPTAMQRNDRLILKSFTKTQYVLTVLNSLVLVLEKINEAAKA